MSNQRPGPNEMVDPLTRELDMTYTEEELAFFKAMDAYKRVNHRAFPTLRETLHVLRSLGYRRLDEPTELPIFIKSQSGVGARGKDHRKRAKLYCKSRLKENLPSQRKGERC